jgi:hypothetical protein
MVSADKRVTVAPATSKRSRDRRKDRINNPTKSIGIYKAYFADRVKSKEIKAAKTEQVQE